MLHKIDKIKIVKNSDVHEHVRVQKFLNVFKILNYDLSYLLWDRKNQGKYKEEVTYLYSGGGYSNKKLAYRYFIWIFKIFSYFVKFKAKDTLVFVIDFDSAIGIYLASLFNKNVIYVYDIHDDFSFRYNFPIFLKNLIAWFDYKIKQRARAFIHVDESRIRAKDRNSVIIYNSPLDFLKDSGNETNVNKYNFANQPYVVSGWLMPTRGMESVYQYALRNPKQLIIIAGEKINNDIDKLLNLDNVKYLGVLKQKELFEIIINCKGIFSLYDPSLEINRLAASNKLYDAMMLGVPVIVNYEIMAASYVEANQIGLAVDYDYNDTWGKLNTMSYDEYLRMGRNGRELYIQKYSYEMNYKFQIEKILNGINEDKK